MNLARVGLPLLRFASLLISISALGACSAEVSQEDIGVGSEELTVCASGTTLKGVDVSHHNATVNWTKVKSSGRVFAFARVSDGIKTPDTKFAQNWPGIRNAGLVRGVYQFFRASRDPVQQADLMLSRINAAGGLKAGDLPPVLDLETNDGVSASVVVARAKKWLQRVEQKTGVKPIFYTGNNMSPTIGTTFASYALWVPHYGVSCPRVPAGWSKWTIWQDSESGNVPGITSGGTDTNFFNGNRTQLNALTLKNNVVMSVSDLEVPDDGETVEDLGLVRSSVSDDAVMGQSMRE